MDSSFLDDTAWNEMLTVSVRDGRSTPKLKNIDTMSKPFSIIATFYCMKFHEKLMKDFINRIFGSFGVSSDNISENKLLRTTCLTLQKDNINSLLNEDQVQTLTRICKGSKDLQQFGKISRSTIVFILFLFPYQKSIISHPSNYFTRYFVLFFSAKCNVF
jgi:hypothetical protein